MKKKIVYVVAFIAFTVSSFGQDAKAILDKVSAKMSEYKTIEGNFEYVFENKSANIEEISRGTFITKGDKYYVNILGVETFFDGQNVYSYMKDVKEVTISVPNTEDEDFISPANIFANKKGFDLEYVKDTVVYGKQVFLINLLPEKEDSSNERIEVYIDKKTNNFVLVKTIGKSGDNVLIHILDMKVNTAISDKIFTFDVKSKPDVEVIDMR